MVKKWLGLEGRPMGPWEDSNVKMELPEEPPDPRDARIAELEKRCDQLTEDNALTQVEFSAARNRQAKRIAELEASNAHLRLALDIALDRARDLAKKETK